MANSIDFLCIGVQKSATSWLWTNLKESKDVWMPPRKELHYFDRSIKYPSPSYLATDSLLMRCISTSKNNKLFRQKCKEEMLIALKSKDKDKIKWYVKYFFSNYNDAWYKSLFSDGEGKIKGEITPAYSLLNIDDIKHIKGLFPKLKIILILRNPVERAWSQIRFYMTRNELNSTSAIDELLRYIDSPMQFMRGDYISILNNWNQVFPQEQIFIGFYDEINNAPLQFLQKVFNFLNIEFNEYSYKYLNTKINKSIERDIPDVIKKHLIMKYVKEVEILSQSFAMYPKSWLLEYYEIINKNQDIAVSKI